MSDAAAWVRSRYNTGRIREIWYYIRHNKLALKQIRSSSVIKNDFNFLLPGILPKPKAKSSKIWECAAYCDYERPKSVKFMSTTHYNLTDSWQNLINLCAQKGQETYLVVQNIHQLTDHIHALASMRDSCVLRRIK